MTPNVTPCAVWAIWATERPADLPLIRPISGKTASLGRFWGFQGMTGLVGPIFFSELVVADR